MKIANPNGEDVFVFKGTTFILKENKGYDKIFVSSYVQVSKIEEKAIVVLSHREAKDTDLDWDTATTQEEEDITFSNVENVVESKSANVMCFIEDVLFKESARGTLLFSCKCKSAESCSTIRLVAFGDSAKRAKKEILQNKKILLQNVSVKQANPLYSADEFEMVFGSMSSTRVY